IESLRILASERDRIRRRVDSGHASVGTLIRNRQRDRARAGAEVEHARLRLVTEQGEAAFYDDLRLGTWDQRARVRVQHEPPESPLAQNVGQGLALPTTFEQGVELARNVLVALF